MSSRAELENYTIDRTGWPKGPLTVEPDRVQWQHAGFACLIVRNSLGALCGYVGVPAGHPYYEKDYESCDALSVHGGLTYSDHCGGPICHVPDPGLPEDVWWLGFDTAHYQDLVPGMLAHRFRGPDHGEKYKDVDYVKGETEQLAEQLRDLALMSGESVRSSSKNGRARISNT